MANILLTTTCVRSCPYCFAKRELEPSSPEGTLSWENLLYLANFLCRSGERHVSLLGGEPTLHPDFVDMFLYLIERGLHVTVFTSGIMAPDRLAEIREHLAKVDPARFEFVCNLNDPEATPAPESEHHRVEAFLDAAGPWVLPGFNMYRSDFDPSFLIDRINRFGLRRKLRLGIAHPVPGQEGPSIADGKIAAVIARLYEFRDLFDRMRVQPILDCGYPLCAFSDEQLGWLYRLSPTNHFGCAPAVDIAPDLSVYCCFPLSQFHRKSVLDFDSMADLVAFYNSLLGKIRQELPGIYEACDGCLHREEGRCAGGGACRLLCRFAHEAPARMPEIEDELAKADRP